MSYHTSGSMSRSYGGGYGTIRISLQNDLGFQSGTTVSYSTGTPPTLVNHGEVELYRINGDLFLIDPQYTLGTPNAPPFDTNDTIVLNYSSPTRIASTPAFSAIRACG